MSEELTKAKAASVADKKREPPEVGLEWGEDNVLRIDRQGDFDRFFEAAPSAAFYSGVIGQIAKIGSQKMRMDEGVSNFAIGFVDCMKPRDAAEILLMTQMAAIHEATMMMARRLNHVENISQQDAAERALNKLMRSYAAQMDTLKRYRSKGQRTVRVECVTVQDGGQAIVGNVQRGGGGDNET